VGSRGAEKGRGASFLLSSEEGEQIFLCQHTSTGLIDQAALLFSAGKGLTPTGVRWNLGEG